MVYTEDVVEVGVRCDDGRGLGFDVFDESEDPFRLVAWINDDCHAFFL